MRFNLVRRARAKEGRPSGFRTRALLRSRTRDERGKLTADLGQLAAQLIMMQRERRLFARKPTACTQNRHVCHSPQRTYPA